MVSEGKMKGAVTATSSTASASMELEQPDLNCPHCNVRLVRIKSKQVKTKGKIYVKCPFSVKVTILLNWEVKFICFDSMQDNPYV